MTLPARLPNLLRAQGLKVTALPGWQQRRRPRSFDPVGVLWHHTGDHNDGRSYADWLGLKGRTDLPAPLCQISIGRDGHVYVLAAGRANHAGEARQSGTVAAGDGNKLYVGVECHNTGSEGWSKAQRDAMVKVGVVLGGVLGCSPAAQRAHRETSVTGKWDPGKLDMDRFRADIAAEAKRQRAPERETPSVRRLYWDLRYLADLTKRRALAVVLTQWADAIAPYTITNGASRRSHAPTLRGSLSDAAVLIKQTKRPGLRAALWTGRQAARPFHREASK